MTTAPTMTLAEKFAALPDRVQGPLFALLDIVAGASQDEKLFAWQQLDHAAKAEGVSPVVAALSDAQARLLFHVFALVENGADHGA